MPTHFAARLFEDWDGSRLAALQNQNEDDAENTISLLRLASTSVARYPGQPPSEHRALLRTIIDTATWKNGELTVTYRAPFDALSNLAKPKPLNR